MSDITRDYPGDVKRRRIHANIIGTTCSECGQPVHRDNVIPLKDGRRPCPDCFDRLWTEHLAGEGMA